LNNVVVSRTTAPDVEAKIDDLYRGALEAFTPARNALVKTVRGADATHVRTLAKPTVVAWAVNQVYWHARATYDRLLKSGERLRAAQIAALEAKPGKAADVREASEAHRRAVADAVQEAERLLREGGAKSSAAASAALMRTFEALSLAPEPPAPPGRLTQPLQPAGFEALAGVTPAARGDHQRPADSGRHRHTPSAAHGSAEAKRSAEEDKRQAAEARRQQAEREREEKHRQAEIRKAEAAVERARAAEAFAREGLERAERDRREAEARLKQLQSG
jgi:hypothetical protein